MARLEVALLPPAPGIYRFRDERDRVLYVGRAGNLRRRVASYWGDLGDRRHLRRMVPRIARVEAAVCQSEHEAAWLERNLLHRSRPYWNRARGGQEVCVHLRLDERATAPGLHVVHEPEPRPGSRLFGPFLGGTRVRLVASAVLRVTALAYAGDGLTGFGRDMARARGLEPGARQAAVAAAAAVLEREPAALAALTAELARRRDEAAERLAFELAGRLQDEIEAVAWVLAEQRAALSEPVDFDVHGWADGVLVRFEMRAGRLGGWRQRPCAEAAAAAAVAATPPAWAAFAQRNAELAARLAAGPAAR